MLTDIPTHLISGPLGAGKTSLIRSLLAQKPADERWAVLINEFGEIGLDAALLDNDDSSVKLAEVAGGCLCCVNGAPFQVGLARLLRKSKPDRLLIEPSGLGHPAELLRQLGAPPWKGVLTLQPCVSILDAAALARSEPMPPSQEQALDHSGLVLLNKGEHLSQAQRAQIVTRLSHLPLRWTRQGELPIAELPGIDQRGGSGALARLALPASPQVFGGVWLDPQQPFCQSQGSADGWSIGWRWHPSQRFDLAQVTHWLSALNWRRAKLVLHGKDGWCSANALGNHTLAYTSSEWRKDSRLELIFDEPQDEGRLTTGMLACRL